MANLKHSFCSLVLQNANSWQFFSLENNFICFSGNLYRKKAISWLALTIKYSQLRKDAIALHGATLIESYHQRNFEIKIQDFNRCKLQNLHFYFIKNKIYIFNREQSLAGAVLGEPFSSIVYCCNATPPRQFRIFQNCLHRLIALPQHVHKCSEIFWSAPNFPEQLIKCISAYIVHIAHKKSCRISCYGHFFMMSHCWETAESAKNVIACSLEFSSRYKMLTIMLTFTIILIGQPPLTARFRWRARLA